MHARRKDTAVGAAATKFTEKACDAGERWLASYFENHGEKAKQRADESTKAFLRKLAGQVDEIEKQSQVDDKTIEEAQDHPDFSATLQKAIISAAQTDQDMKHELLARLIAERLKNGSESLMAVASKMACDAISCSTEHQLKALGVLANVLNVQPDPDFTGEHYMTWLDARIGKLLDTSLTALDVMHLQAISCIACTPFISNNLDSALGTRFGSFYKPEEFAKSDIGCRLQRLWEDGGLKFARLTSIGMLIGVYAADAICGTQTGMDAFTNC